MKTPVNHGQMENVLKCQFGHTPQVCIVLKEFLSAFDYLQSVHFKYVTLRLI